MEWMNSINTEARKSGKKTWKKEDSRKTPRVIASAPKSECKWESGMPFTKSKIQKEGQCLRGKICEFNI